MYARIVSDSSADWDDVLARVPHDIYQLRSYATLSADHEGGQAMAYLAEDEDNALVVPFIVRDLPPGYETSSVRCDATCPRGYPGPVYAGGGKADTLAFLDRAVDHFVEALREQGIVSAFIRLHPLLDVPEAPLRRVGRIVHHSETVYVDLSLSPEALWGQTRGNHRRHINKARKEGYVARIDESWATYEDFVEIYAETMKRANAEPHWHLSKEYFDGLRLALGDTLQLCVVEFEGRVVAAGLFSEMDGVLGFLFGGTRNEYLRESPAKTMLHFASTWGRERELKVFHLGGSQTPDDSLMKFKVGFSPLKRPVQSWRIVADPSAYEDMRRKWLSLNGDHTADPQFFPVYRA